MPPDSQELHHSKSYAEAVATLTITLGLVLRRKPDWELLSSHLKPFEHVAGFPEVAADSSAKMMSLLLAVLGDCYRELGFVNVGQGKDSQPDAG